MAWRLPWAALWALTWGCQGSLLGVGEGGSLGRPNHGALRGGQALAERGPGHILARPGDATRYGTPRLVGALERAFAEVQRRFGGGAPMRVGDLSWPGGGRHPRHGSHRVGRDVDLIFFATDAAGRSVQGRGWLAFDSHGIARERRVPSGTPSGQLFFFDTARNWHLVRTLLSDPEASVQWMFCSWGVKARLLRYAVVHEPDAGLIARAAVVLHQPSRGRAHDDHFHVRMLCDAQERAQGCRDYGPVWPWLRDAVDKAGPVAREPLDDATLVRLLMEDLPEQSTDGPAGAAAGAT